MFQNVLIILLVVVGFWLLKSLFPAKRKPKLGQGTSAKKFGPYQAVSIHAYSQGCSAAESLKGKRFLATGTPLLPLEDCASAECHCVYVHHADRRSGNGGRRTALDTAEQQLIPGQQDRRQGGGRRNSDFSPVPAVAGFQSPQ